MSNTLIIKNKIKSFKKNITVTGDKSISIRWILFSSIADGISRAQNLLRSEDVLAAIDAIRKLGIKVKLTKKSCVIYGKGINGYKYKNNLKKEIKVFLNFPNTPSNANLISSTLI